MCVGGFYTWEHALSMRAAASSLETDLTEGEPLHCGGYYSGTFSKDNAADNVFFLLKVEQNME